MVQWKGCSVSCPPSGAESEPSLGIPWYVHLGALERRWDSWMHDHVYLHQQVHCFWFAGVWQELQKHDKSVQSMKGLLGHFFAHRNRPGDHGYGWGAGSLVLGTLTQQSCDCFALAEFIEVLHRDRSTKCCFSQFISIHFFKNMFFFSRNIWSPFGHYSMTTFAYMYVYT